MTNSPKLMTFVWGLWPAHDRAPAAARAGALNPDKGTVISPMRLAASDRRRPPPRPAATRGARPLAA
ncbi:MAG: hypothetical protein ACKVWR_15225, partial [Acidimicrobiales bacterium]